MPSLVREVIGDVLREARMTQGRTLREVLPHLVDFTADGRQLSDWELSRIPPLLALSTGGLSRGLLRLRLPSGVRTVDAVATPLRRDGTAVGSLSFFQQI